MGFSKVHSALAGTISPAGSRVCVLPFRERCEYVPVRSLSNVLFSRVPEGQNTDSLTGLIPMPRVIADAQPFFRALLGSWHLRGVRSRCPGPAVNPSLEACGSGPCPRKGGFSHPAGSQRPCWCRRLKCLWNPAGRLCRPFAWKASSHNPGFIDRFSAIYNPRPSWRERFG